MKKKILLIQTHVGLSLKDLNQIERTIIKTKPDFVCFPEYFYASSCDLNKQYKEGKIALNYLRKLSEKIPKTLVIGGTLVEKIGKKFFNTCYIINHGKIVSKYQKVFLTQQEKKRGLTPGNRFKVVAFQNMRVGVMVCNDVLTPFASSILCKKRLDFLFVPLISPKRKVDPTKKWRENLFVLRAFETKSYLIKVGSIGELCGSLLAGRSLVASPWGILWKTKKEDMQDLKLITLDLQRLREYRKNEPLYKY